MTDLDLSMTPTPETLIFLLRQLEERFRRSAASPSEAGGAPAADSWGGILTHCGGQALIVPLREIREILNFPARVTSVPLTSEWVLGIANNRGSLLPLFDLQEFLFGERLVRDDRTRVLVVEHGQTAVGLVVESSVGMLHLSKTDMIDAPAVDDDVLSLVVEARAEVDGQSVSVLSVQRLLSAEGFRAIAA